MFFSFCCKVKSTSKNETREKQQQKREKEKERASLRSFHELRSILLGHW